MRLCFLCFMQAHLVTRHASSPVFLFTVTVTRHGPHTTCPLPLTSKLVLDYLSAPSDSSSRHAIERRYGRNNVLRLVRQYEEEQENKKWMDSSTTTCPGCEVKVEKSMGCNHVRHTLLTCLLTIVHCTKNVSLTGIRPLTSQMTCAKCKTHFCYRCGAKIPAADPYKHFSTPRTPCFSKLFDFVHEENEWQPVEGFAVI